MVTETFKNYDSDSSVLFLTESFSYPSLTQYYPVHITWLRQGLSVMSLHVLLMPALVLSGYSPAFSRSQSTCIEYSNLPVDVNVSESRCLCMSALW